MTKEDRPLDLEHSNGFAISSVGGIPFAITDLPTATEWLQASALRGDAVSVRLSNAYCVALSDTDPKYKEVLLGSGVNFPDGAPVVWFMRRHRKSAHPGTAQRVRGPSMFITNLNASQTSGTSNFFLGTTTEALALLVKRIKDDFPSTKIAGTYAPPFAPISEAFLDACAKQIIESRAGIVWVGLGTPKQDFVSSELARRTGRPCVGVGAAFDFAAGTVAEAPKWVQDSGFEWAFRLLSEPRRLWRRYLFGNVRFLRVALAYGARHHQKRYRALG